MSAHADRPAEGRGLTRAELMTAEELGQLLGVATSTVLHWGRIGVLPRVKLGRHVRFVRSHVEQAILRAETAEDEPDR
jgi:excisionase family DNA binding protein